MILIRDHPRAVMENSKRVAVSYIKCDSNCTLKCLGHLDVFEYLIQKAKCAESPMAEMFFCCSVMRVCPTIPLDPQKAKKKN